MNVLRCICLLLLFMFARIRATNNPETTSNKFDAEYKDGDEIETSSSASFVTAKPYEAQAIKINKILSQVKKTQADTINLIIYCIIPAHVLFKPEFEPECMDFCLKHEQGTQTFFPLIDENTCEGGHIIKPSTLPYENISISYYLIYLNEHAEDYFLYWISPIMNSAFNFLYIKYYPKTDPENGTTLIENQENTIHNGEINILDTIWNDYVFGPAIILVHQTTKNAWLELHSVLRNAQFLLKDKLMITVIYNTTMPAIGDKAESEISGFFVRATFNISRNIKFSIINYPDPSQYSDQILKDISHSVCKMNDWNFKSRIYCYNDTEKGETLLQMPPETIFAPITIYLQDNVPKLIPNGTLSTTGTQLKYYHFCPRNRIMADQTFFYESLVQNDSFQKLSFSCMQPGRLQQILMPSGKIILNGILIPVKNTNKNGGNKSSINFNLQSSIISKEALENFELSAVTDDEREIFLVGRKFLNIGSFSFWFIELFRFYLFVMKVHRHFISPDYIVETENIDDFYSPYKCIYNELNYEWIFSKENIENILMSNVSDEHDREAMMHQVAHNNYIKPIPPVSPLDIQFQGYKTITTGCSVFGIWSSIYADHWSGVEKLTRRTAKSSTENLLVLTGVLDKLIFKSISQDMKQDFILNKHNNERYRIQMYHTIWRLFMYQGEPMFFVLVNNIFHYQGPLNPFEEVKSFCSTSCTDKELGYLNADPKKPLVFCCKRNEIRQLKNNAFNNFINSEIEKMIGIRNIDVTSSSTSISETKNEASITCYTTKENKEKCREFCLEHINDRTVLFPILPEEGRRRRRQRPCDIKIKPKNSNSKVTSRQIVYQIFPLNENPNYFFYSYTMDASETRYSYKLKKPSLICHELLRTDTEFFLDKTSTALNINLMEDFFTTFESSKYVVFKSAKVTLYSKINEMWKKIEENIKLAATRNISFRTPITIITTRNIHTTRLPTKIKFSILLRTIYTMKQSYFVETTVYGKFPASVMATIRESFLNFPYVSKKISFAATGVNFVLINYPFPSYFANLPKPCKSTCKSNGWKFPARFVYCCDYLTDDSSSYVPNTSILKMPRKPGTGYDPIVVYLNTENELKIRWKTESYERSLSYSYFCAPEERGNEINEMAIRDYAYFINMRNEKLCEYPTLYNQISIQSQVSYGIRFQWNLMKDSKMSQPIELANNSITPLNPVLLSRQSSANIWYMEIFRIIKSEEALVYKYEIPIQSTTDISDKDRAQKMENNAYQAYDCVISTFQNEKLLSEDNIDQIFRNNFSDTRRLSTYTTYLWEHGYLSPILIVPTSDMTFLGWSSLTSIECHNFFMWSEIYNRHWSLVEKVSLAIVKELSHNAIIYTSSHGRLVFNNESLTNFSLYENTEKQELFIVPSEIWRVVATASGSLVFSVINDIFYYMNETERPFTTNIDNMVCRGRCESLGYEFLNTNLEEPFIFCCHANFVIEHGAYRNIFHNENVSSELLSHIFYKNPLK